MQDHARLAGPLGKGLRRERMLVVEQMADAETRDPLQNSLLQRW